jgi:hypothetical protein
MFCHTDFQCQGLLNSHRCFSGQKQKTQSIIVTGVQCTYELTADLDVGDPAFWREYHQLCLSRAGREERKLFWRKHGMTAEYGNAILNHRLQKYQVNESFSSTQSHEVNSELSTHNTGVHHTQPSTPDQLLSSYQVPPLINDDSLDRISSLESAASATFQCSHCGRNFAEERALKRHLRRDQRHCFTCDRVFECHYRKMEHEPIHRAVWPGVGTDLHV